MTGLVADKTKLETNKYIVEKLEVTQYVKDNFEEEIAKIQE